MVKALALFWRYGHLLLFLILCFFLSSHVSYYTAYAGYFFLYGVYTIIIASLCCEHFKCGMQNAYRGKMTPYADFPYDWLRKARREGIFIGILFSVLGIALFIVERLKL